RDAIEGDVAVESAPCWDALWVKPKAAKKACFSPLSPQAVFLWAYVAERMGMNVETSEKPWVEHAEPPETFFHTWQDQARLNVMVESLEYVFGKSSFRVFSDYLLDEACAEAMKKADTTGALPNMTAEKIALLKDPILTKRARLLTEKVQLPELKELREEARRYFSALKGWRGVVDASREKDLINFYVE
ncbi:MAG TPA: hypothetical protein VI874_03200, partial [Candidatus Norongarragalinales archaeon]|nr:hypothetical protein [Candidatus Norongarragalinales archaeon]